MDTMPRVPKSPLTPLNLGSETIGERLARLRKERGYSQKQLAHKIGIEQKIISDYETGKLRLYDKMVARFALALGVSTDTILGLKQSKPLEKKPSLRIWRRLKQIDELPPAKQKTILRSLDFMLQSAGQKDENSNQRS